MDRILESQYSNDKRKSMKRAWETAESGICKKRRLEVDEQFEENVKPRYKNTTFANDRLKNLRNKLSNELANTIPSSISRNNVSNVHTQGNTRGCKHTNTCETSTKSLDCTSTFQRNKFMRKGILPEQQCNLNSTRKSVNHIHHSYIRNEIRSRGVDHTIEQQNETQLQADAVVSDIKLPSFMDKKCALSTSQSKICKNRYHRIKELQDSVGQKDLSLAQLHNKLDISISNDEDKKSRISIEMRKSPSSNIYPTNISSQTVPSHNNSLNISITNSSLETEHSKATTSLSLFTDISTKRVETKELCNNVNNDFSLCSSSTSYVQDLLKDRPCSSRQSVHKEDEDITPGLSPTKESPLNMSNAITDNSPKVNVESFEDSTKCWTNYSQIIDSFYKKFFSSDEENEIFSRDDSFSESGTRQVDQRNSTNDQDAMEWDDDNVTNDTGKTSKPSRSEMNCLQQEMYIIVDTNIFLKDLDILQDIVSCGSNGRTKCILYVPWMVLTELDFMKDDRSTGPQLKRKVIEAVSFINKTLLAGGKKLIGQNIFEAEQQKHLGKAPDDKIVSCCLQAKQNNLNVILLSNDTNLKNKLLVNDIPAFSSSEMFKNPIIFTSNGNSVTENNIQEKFQKLTEKMGICCSYIICESVTSAYGKVWNKMDLLEDSPPWTFDVCLRIFKKYWFAVFRERLLKHFLKTVQQLDTLLNILESSKNTDKFEEYVQECLSLCIFFKDLEEHKEFVENTLDDMNSFLNFR